MHRATLERQQVWIYLTAIGLGLGVGSVAPALAPWLEILLWPTLMLLLYATFVQVPLLHVREAFGDGRFVAAVLIGNFALLPLVAWALVLWLPANPVLIVGVLLVLLVPCTDWFITFSQLGGGNVPRANRGDAAEPAAATGLAAALALAHRWHRPTAHAGLR